jgi:hypothetical protein
VQRVENTADGEAPTSRMQSLGADQRGVTLRRVASMPISSPEQETERLVAHMPVSTAQLQIWMRHHCMHVHGT